MEAVAYAEALAHPQPQQADGRGAVIEAFRNVDAEDWENLDSYIPYSENGKGQFWRAVFKEVRAALSQAPATDGAGS